MNADQADYVLAQMSVCWAGKPLTVEEVKFWVAKLENYEFDHAMDALSKISDKAKDAVFFLYPTIIVGVVFIRNAMQIYIWLYVIQEHRESEAGT